MKTYKVATERGREVSKTYQPSPTVSVAESARALDFMNRYKRCGVFASVRGGELVSFIPFYNPDFTCVSPPTCDPGYYRRKVVAQQQRAPEDVIKDPRRWWFNGAVVCNVAGPWGTAGLGPIRDMFREIIPLIKAVPDCDFFVNRRDYPQIRRDGRLAEPAQNNPRPSRTFPSSIPVFSAFTGPGFADKPMPPADDWALVSKGAALLERAARLPFKDRKPQAVFRGSATGPGVSLDTNHRLMLATLSRVHPLLFDAGITSLSHRDQVDKSGRMQFMDHTKLRRVLPKAPFMAIEEQMRFQIVLYAQGHSAAARFGTLMHTGCLIVRLRESVDAPDLWFFPRLISFNPLQQSSVPEDADHVIVDPVTPDNVTRVVRWVLSNPDTAERITRNAARKARQIFTRESIAAYIGSALVPSERVHDVYRGDRLGTSASRFEADLACLRRLNNAVKVVSFVRQALRRKPRRVLDIACGEGGDILKWDRLGTEEYIGFDLVPKQVERFRMRLRNISLQSIQKTTLHVRDARDPFPIETKVDAISMQFALHYIADTRGNTERFLRSVFCALNEGGAAIITTTNGREIQCRLRSEPSWTNGLCSIASVTKQGGWGGSYRFELDVRVPDSGAIEYIVDEYALLELAKEIGFKRVLCLTFREALALGHLRDDTKAYFSKSNYRLPVVCEQSRRAQEVFDLYNVFVFET